MHIDSLDSLDLRPLGREVHVTVGTFDGVHRGHVALIQDTIAGARARGALSAVFTFQNHPRSIVAPERCPAALTPWPRKAHLLAQLGADVLIGLPFTAEFSQVEPRDFVREILFERCAARVIASGSTFHFGHRGGGNVALLQEMAAELGYEYRPEEAVEIDGVNVTSTLIREALSRGDVVTSAGMLGRPHRIEALVVRGDALGRTIGFPTANLDVHSSLALPADGVYAVEVSLPPSEGGEGPRRWPGMMNLGWRPTVGGRQHRVEVHLIGFDGDLVDARLAVDFIARLRGEQRFDSLPALGEQLNRDRAATLVALASATGQ